MKKHIAFLLIALSATPLFPVSLEALLGIQQAQKLGGQAGSTISELQLKNPLPVLLPNHSQIKNFVLEMYHGLQPSIVVETLYLYQTPQASWSEEERLGLFNQALAISTLAGTQYFSASRNEMRTFYETSQVIDSPGSNKVIPDPVFAQIPETFTLYARQKDLTFGDNIYSYQYRAYPDAMISMQENLSSLNTGGIPVIGKNKLRSFMAIFDCDGALLIYTASLAKTTPLPGMGERIGKSFTNRAEAFQKWYIDKADIVLGKQ